MSDNFDPYFKWLSIPPDQQPPDHYRLLGVPEFVDDADVIENAADKQVLLLRSVGAGKRAAIAQKLLNEISAAKLTLLDPAQKSAYDAQLRQSTTSRSVPRTRASQPASANTSPTQGASSAPQISININRANKTNKTNKTKPQTKPKNNGRQKPKTLFVIGGVLAALILGGLLLILTSSKDPSPEVADVKSTTLAPLERVSETRPKPTPDSRSETAPDSRPDVPPQPEVETPSEPETGNPASTSTVSNSRAVNLLSTLDLERDSLRGKSTLNNGKLGSGRETSMLQFNTQVRSPEYDITMVVRKTDSSYHVSMGLVGPAGEQFFAVMTADNSGLSLLDGKPWDHNPTTSRQHLPKDQKPHVIVYQIRNEGVTVSLDGKTFLNWQGGYHRLTLNPDTPTIGKGRLFVSSRNTRIEKLEFRPLAEDHPVAIAPSATPSQAVDLLSVIDLEKHSANGKWTLEGGILRASERSLLRIDYPVTVDQYDVCVVMRNTGREHHVALGLLSPGKQLFSAVMHSSRNGIGTLLGRRWQENSTTKRPGLPADGKPHTLLYQVRHTGVTMLLDGKACVKWNGDYRQLTPNLLLSVASSKNLSLAARNVVIEKLEFRPLVDGNQVAVAPSTASTVPVNLLAKIDLDKNILRGKWALDEKGLRGVESGSILEIDYLVRFSEYDIAAVVKSISPESYLSVGLVSPIEQQFSLAITGRKGGLSMLDGKRFDDNSTTTERIKPWDGKHHTLVYQVRKDGVTLMLDGEPQLQWRGEYRRLTTPPGVDTSSNRVLFLSSRDVAIEKLEFHPLGAEPKTTHAATINLLSNLDPKKNTLDGQWKLTEGELRIDENAALHLNPQVGADEYDVELVMRTEVGERQYIHMGLVSPQGKQFGVAISSKGSGFHLVRGRKYYQNETTSKKTMPLDQQFHTYLYQVRQERVVVLVDGKKQCEFQGDYEQLRRDQRFSKVPSRFLFLGGSKITIKELNYKPLGALPKGELPPIANNPPQPGVLRDRHSVPSEEQQQAALTLIKDVFQEAYENAKSKSERAELAQKLNAQAMQTPKDHASRYMLYREARRLATLAGDEVTALGVAEALGREFDIPREAISLETIEALTKTVQFTPQRKHLAESTLALIDTAVAEYRYDTIEELIDVALATARASRDKDLLKKVVDRRRELEEVTKAYASAEQALKTLAEKPDDPQANFIAGRFVLLVLNDTPRGLQMLAKGNNTTLKSLAVAVLANPPSGKDQAELGDRWNELASSLDGRMRQSALQRAAQHYRQALESLRGLSRALVEKKLKDLGEN